MIILSAYQHIIVVLLCYVITYACECHSCQLHMARRIYRRMANNTSLFPLITKYGAF